MSDRPVVSVDFDGVFTRPHAIKAEELCRLGHEVRPDQTEREYVTVRLGVPLEDYELAAHRANHLRLDEIELEPGAVLLVEQLVALGAEPVIVTARREEELRPVYEFLERHHISIDRICPSARGSKVAALRELGAILHVDDSPRHLLQIRAGLPAVSLVLFANEANRWWIEENQTGELTVGGFAEVLGVVESITSHPS